MKKFLGIVVLGLILVGNAYSETKFSEIKKALKEVLALHFDLLK